MKSMVWTLFLGALLCADGCNGDGGGICENVTCNEPPVDYCLDDSTLRAYEATGTCDQVTGSCDYAYSDTACEKGCADGRCIVDTVAWGYITLFESPDNLCEPTMHEEWCDNVRAYFTTAPSYPRALPHHLDFMCHKKTVSGACAYYTECNQQYTTRAWLRDLFPRRTGCQDCTADQECITPDSGGWGCRDVPPHWDVGELTVQGLKNQIAFQKDELDRYRVTAPPADLFDAGAAISVEAAGGDLSSFTLAATGVHDLEIQEQVLYFSANGPARFEWTPADPESRVELLLLAGWHFPFLPSQAMLCEAPDENGEIEIPADLAADFVAGGAGIYKISRITRFHRQVIRPFGDDIELLVGSVRAIQISMP